MHRIPQPPGPAFDRCRRGMGLLGGVVVLLLNPAQALERYDVHVSAGQWYNGIGNSRSASKPWGPDWPVPQEFIQYETQASGAMLQALASVTGEMQVGRLLTIGESHAVATPSGGFGISGGSSGYIALEWQDTLTVRPNALRDADGFLRLPWFIDYSGEIEIKGQGGDTRTGAQVQMRLSATVSPYGCWYCNVLGYTSPTYAGLEFTQSYFATEGLGVFDVNAGPANPYHGVIEIPNWASEVRLAGSMVMSISTGVPGAGNLQVTAEQSRPFRFYIDLSSLALGQLVQSASGADYSFTAPPPVPEPASAMLLLVGLAGLAGMKARTGWLSLRHPASAASPKRFCGGADASGLSARCARS